MENLIEFKTENGHTVYLEATPINKPTGGFQQVSINTESVINQATDSLTQALEPVKSVAESILKAFSAFNHAPDEISVELAIKISAEAGVIITKGSVEGNFKINLKWKKDESNNG